jgi:hypothetical protein
MGLLATGLFGIPIGVLGAGFESLVSKGADDTPDAEEDEERTSLQIPILSYGATIL